MVDRCRLTELPKDGCAHCRGIADIEVSRPLGAEGPSVTAGYPGVCSGCGNRISVGDLIRRSSTAGWLGECCAGEGDA